MKYFITGATGFLGSRIAKMLIDRNHEVIALVRNPDKAEQLKKAGIKIIKGDITDKESMREAMRKTDGVFHIAAWYKIGLRDKSQAWNINVKGTQNVLELMKKLNIPKGIYTSTLAINSDTKGEVHDESFEFNGNHISVYDETKAEAHKIAKKFISEGLPLVILMPGIIYGRDGTSLSDESLRMFLKKKLPLIPKKSAYNWAHVDDVAEIHITAMEKAHPGKTYIVAGPQYTVEEAFEIASNITGIRKPISVPPELLRLTGFFSSIAEKIISLPPMYSSEALRVQAGATYLGDNSKAKRELNYHPRSLENGFKDVLLYELSKIKTSY